MNFALKGAQALNPKKNDQKEKAMKSNEGNLAYPEYSNREEKGKQEQNALKNTMFHQEW
jgi:hypothetical protein